MHENIENRSNDDDVQFPRKIFNGNKTIQSIDYFVLADLQHGTIVLVSFRNGTLKHIGEMHVPWISSYLDFIAFLSVLVIMVFIASGARISITVNR